MADERDDAICKVCGEPIPEGQEWLGLNRYSLGAGHARGMHEGWTEHEYFWHMAEDDETCDDEKASGPYMHWPTCAMMFIEGRLAEIRVIIPPDDD